MYRGEHVFQSKNKTKAALKLNSKRSLEYTGEFPSYGNDVCKDNKCESTKAPTNALNQIY